MQITESFAANIAKRFQIAGTFFRLESTFYPVTARFLRGGAYIDDEILSEEAGTAIRVADGFDAVEISTATAQTVKFSIARGAIQKDRIAGEVSVINGEVARVLANRCHIGFGVQTAVAAQYSHVQLWNPAGSGKRALVSRLWCENVTGSVLSYGLTMHNAALSTLLNAVPSKRSGGAASTAQIRSQANATVIGSSPGLASLTIQVGDTAQFFLAEPIALLPGYGLVVYTGGVNLTLSVSFQFTEEDDV